MPDLPDDLRGVDALLRTMAPADPAPPALRARMLAAVAAAGAGPRPARAPRRRLDRFSAGTFHPDPEGVSDVRRTAAVDPAKYPILIVTAESGDGDPRPSRDVVLRSGG